MPSLTPATAATGTVVAASTSTASAVAQVAASSSLNAATAELLAAGVPETTLFPATTLYPQERVGILAAPVSSGSLSPA